MSETRQSERRTMRQKSYSRISSSEHGTEDIPATPPTKGRGLTVGRSIGGLVKSSSGGSSNSAQGGRNMSNGGLAKKPSRRGYNELANNTSAALSPPKSNHSRQSSLFSLNLTPHQPNRQMHSFIAGASNRVAQYYSTAGNFVGAGAGILLPSQQQGPELEEETKQYYQQQLASFNLLEPVLNPCEQSHDIWTTLLNSEFLGGEGELEEYDPEAYNDPYQDNPLLDLERYMTDVGNNLGGWMSTLTGTAPPSILSQPSMPLQPIIKPTNAQGGYYDPQHLPDFLAKLDLSDFHRFMGRTGPSTNKFFSRGEQLAEYRMVESDEEDEDDYDFLIENQTQTTQPKDSQGLENGNNPNPQKLPFMPLILDPDNTDERVNVEDEDPDNFTSKPIDASAELSANSTNYEDKADHSSQQQENTPSTNSANKEQGKLLRLVKIKQKKSARTPEEKLRSKLLNKNNYPTMLECEALVPDMFFMEEFDLTRPLNFELLMTHLEEQVGGMELMFPLDDKERKARREKRQRVREEKQKQKQLRKEARKKAKQEEEEERRLKDGAPRVDETNQETLPMRDRERRREVKKKKKKPQKKQKSPPTLKQRQDRLLKKIQKKQSLQADQMALLSSYLDSVEMSLLEQVRSKSQAYFTETSRFAELKTLVKDGCDQVVSLKSVLVELQLCNVEDVERIPREAYARNALDQLSHLLELCDNVAITKASVAGLLSMNDTRGAIEAIRGSRVLLTLPDRSRRNHHFSLGNLKALSGVNQQLGEYESIVVESLSTALVDIFLAWESHDSSLFDSFGLSPSDIFTSSGNAIEQSKKARNIIESLSLCNKLSQTNTLYVNKLCDVIKVTVKTTVQECAADARLINSNSLTKDPSLPSPQQPSKQSGITYSVSNMTFDQFMDCLDMLFEQILSRLRSAMAVSKFLLQEGLVLRDEGDLATEDAGDDTSAAATSSSALAVASELSHKSISELLRLKKDVHSLLSLEEMQRLWDSCLTYTIQLEKMSGCKAYGLRSTLLAQTKAFVERKHQSNMTSLVAALDSEKWIQCHVSEERQASLTRLCTGRAVLGSAALMAAQRIEEGTEAGEDVAPASSVNASKGKREVNDAEVEGTKYKIVWSCLLLVELVMADVSCAAHFQTLATSMVGKIVELLTLFNTRSTQLVLGAGAIHSSAKLRSINAKHLALVTQCLGMMISLLPHIRAALMAQLPAKQHVLLHDLDKIKQDYADHLEKVLTKFVSILSGIVEHGLAPRIAKTNFDERSKQELTLCPFLDGVLTNTRKMHQVLILLLPPEHLIDVYARIFLYLDQKIPLLFQSAASENGGSTFQYPTTESGKLRMVAEMQNMTETLNKLTGVSQWDFTIAKHFEKELGLVKYQDEAPLADSEVTKTLPASNNPDEVENLESCQEPDANADLTSKVSGVITTQENGDCHVEDEKKADGFSDEMFSSEESVSEEVVQAS